MKTLLDGVCDDLPRSEPPRTVSATTDIDVDDPHWKDLDYKPISLNRAGQVAIQLEFRGTLKPMAHHLNEESPSMERFWASINDDTILLLSHKR